MPLAPWYLIYIADIVLLFNSALTYYIKFNEIYPIPSVYNLSASSLRSANVTSTINFLGSNLIDLLELNP